MLYQYFVQEESILLLRSLIGKDSLQLYTSTVDVTWNRFVLAPHFSILSGPYPEANWIILESNFWSSIGSTLETSYLRVSGATHPKDVPYVQQPSGNAVLRDRLCAIEIAQAERRASRIETLVILSEEVQDELHDHAYVQCDHSLLFTFTDGYQCAISSALAPSCLLECTTDPTTIARLVAESQRRVFLDKAVD